MDQQQSLFESPLGRPARPAGLTLAAQPDRPLTKAQQTFNRLVNKIEKLRAKLERETRRLDAALVAFSREIHPRRQRQAALLKELVRVLAPFLDDRRLKRKDLAVLREIIANQLNIIAAAGGTGLDDEDLRTLFKKVNGISVEESEAEAFEGMKDMMGEMFDDLGVDIDLDGLRPDMSAAEVAAHAAQMAERLQQQEEAQAAARAARPTRPKSKRRLQQEERARQVEELRSKSIASIYKQLAKLLHPDLEPNPARRQQKVALMQELTAAYRHNDLHTLLRLELEWIRGEQGDVTQLTDEKLAIYNHLLREQADDLEQEVFVLPQHPRYQALADPMAMFAPRLQTDVAAEAARLDGLIASIEVGLARLRAGEALAEVRGAITTFRQAAARFDAGPASF